MSCVQETGVERDHSADQVRQRRKSSGLQAPTSGDHPGESDGDRSVESGLAGLFGAEAKREPTRAADYRKSAKDSSHRLVQVLQNRLAYSAIKHKQNTLKTGRPAFDEAGTQVSRGITGGQRQIRRLRAGSDRRDFQASELYLQIRAGQGRQLRQFRRKHQILERVDQGPLGQSK